MPEKTLFSIVANGDICGTHLNLSEDSDIGAVVLGIVYFLLQNRDAFELFEYIMREMENNPQFVKKIMDECVTLDRDFFDNLLRDAKK